MYHIPRQKNKSQKSICSILYLTCFCLHYVLFYTIWLLVAKKLLFVVQLHRKSFSGVAQRNLFLFNTYHVFSSAILKVQENKRLFDLKFTKFFYKDFILPYFSPLCFWRDCKQVRSVVNRKITFFSVLFFPFVSIFIIIITSLPIIMLF